MHLNNDLFNKPYMVHIISASASSQEESDDDDIRSVLLNSNCALYKNSCISFNL